MRLPKADHGFIEGSQRVHRAYVHTAATGRN
jgi:hypothetical protein